MWVSIDRHANIPMFRQIFQRYREEILSGSLPAGHKLPSTRELAGELGVSRNVILEAYELLMAEGYIAGRPGAGTYVAEGASFMDFKSPEPSVGAAIVVETAKKAEEDIISFRTGLPALDRFPIKQWSAMLQQVLRVTDTSRLGYGDSSGEPELRTLLADHLRHTRGVVCSPDQIIITNGAVQALQLITQILLRPGDDVLVEDPSNEDLNTILTSTGAAVRSVPVDDAGLMTHLLPEAANPKCIYATPSHQFPIGGILPIQRRIELLAYASRQGSYVLEDDYDSEFRFDGSPVHSLQSLRPERVIYIGTFSKIMFPSLRIGYMVVPAPLVEACRERKRLSVYQTPSVEQLALVRFIEEGYLNAHLLKMKKLYKKRRQIVTEALKEHLPAGCRICGQAAGLHLAIEFERPLPSDLEERMREEGVQPGMYCGSRRMMIGYGHLDEGQIREGIRRIAQALKESARRLDEEPALYI